ncbi:MAG: PEP-CTERM sorting domain-containing protein [Microcystis wesenbergii Mw_QC_S_20081001_S30D]|uniref:PEP-CTERM sorting domain-containing protein n=1 Tax=Microcystis wesenbergii Mw_QC_S_20081001_S30D TaxID=2486245 RepID=A0A552JJW8_9CHRO|nr:PEP-CTERM sorting domain-containing protein [Microcystis aeruginosa W11-03]NCR93567.1 PEP-CTERM sorting domain-containing protein [Microcystis aeruginosa W11-06]TRU95784.1 MAG: PEP-CTERM sorting domain-containing protein [Microcystis wesenbergii Mw_QC_S_20081001_S30D]TRV06050.1 MAG: PEP-CTERM sorting domain-containing protein [Microcystis wesenbergii Mw_QC_S_20081001_S30]
MKIKQLCFVSGVALATLATAGAAQAALVVVPPGLNPGDQFRLVFVTSGTRDATSSNINDYNTFVTNQVTGSALATELTNAGFNLGTITWKAIGSTPTVAARDNTGTNPSSTGVPIYLIDGNRVANNNGDLWDGSIQTAINRTQSDTVLSTRVWTGTDTSGVPAFCSFGSGCGATGDAGSTGLGWIFSNPSVDADDDGVRPLYSLYAMSSLLTVPQSVSVPESTVPVVGFITLGGLMLGSAVSKARK